MKKEFLIVLLLLCLLFAGCISPSQEQPEQKTFEKYGFKFNYTVGTGWIENPLIAAGFSAIAADNSSEVAIGLSKEESQTDTSFLGVIIGETQGTGLTSLKDLPQELILGQEIGGFGKVKKAELKTVGSVEWLLVSVEEDNEKTEIAISLCNQKAVAAILTGKEKYLNGNKAYFNELLQSAECNQ